MTPTQDATLAEDFAVLGFLPNPPDNLWGQPIFRYSRAQAIADGVLADLTTAADDQGQRLCPQAGFKVPVAIPATPAPCAGAPNALWRYVWIAPVLVSVQTGATGQPVRT